MTTVMAINIRDHHLEELTKREAARRGSRSLSRTLREVALERFVQLESQSPIKASTAGQDEGGKNKEELTPPSCGCQLHV